MYTEDKGLIQPVGFGAGFTKGKESEKALWRSARLYQTEKESYSCERVIWGKLLRHVNTKSL